MGDFRTHKAHRFVDGDEGKDEDVEGKVALCQKRIGIIDAENGGGLGDQYEGTGDQGSPKRNLLSR